MGLPAMTRTKGIALLAGQGLIGLAVIVANALAFYACAGGVHG